MKDRYTNERILSLHPKVVPIFQSFLKSVETELNVIPRITSALRTFKEQEALYNQGRTTAGKIVTNAKAGTSYHNYGLAIDVAIVKEDGSIDWNYDMNKLAKIAKIHNIEWGGDFKSIKDYPHFQVTFGHSIIELLNLHNNGLIKNGYVQI